MIRPNSPCRKDCSGRSPTCHSTCAAYLEWREAYDAWQRQQREEIDKYMAVSWVEIARSKRIERRRKRC